MYVMPGLIDNHVHTGGPGKAPEAEYVYKLWLGHGVTTVRGVPFGPMDWSLSEKRRSAASEIVAPRMVVYQRMGTGEEWDESIRTPEQAREWVRCAHEKGVDGLKLGVHWPPIMEALLDEANRLGMGSTAPEKPLENLKVLYGTGAVKLNDETGRVERVGGVRWTIKDGIVYDARKLLADVRAMMDEQESSR